MGVEAVEDLGGRAKLKPLELKENVERVEVGAAVDATGVVPGLAVSHDGHIRKSLSFRQKHPSHSHDPSLGLNSSANDLVCGLSAEAGASLFAGATDTFPEFDLASSKTFLNF